MSVGRLSRLALSIGDAVGAGARGRMHRLDASAGAEVVTTSTLSTKSNQPARITAKLNTGKAATQWELTQTSGPAAKITGDPADWLVTARGGKTLTPLTFTVRALADGVWTAAITVRVNVARHLLWATRANKTLVPVEMRKADKPISGNATPGLFFELPKDIREKDRKYFGHYFAPYPRSIDNQPYETDVITRAYLTPETGESGKHAPYGGLLRDRPTPRNPIDGDYLYIDAKRDVENAMAGGLDGFFIDLLGLSGSNWDRYIKLRDAAHDNYPGFYVIPMIDANGAHGLATTEEVVTSLYQYAKHRSSYYLNDGRYVIGSFKTEGKPAEWWLAIMDRYREKYGTSIAHFPVFLDYTAKADQYLNVTTVASSWGVGSDPAVIKNGSNMAAAARARGHKWMQPITPQNIRPNQKWYDEAGNTECLREGWLKTIRDAADFVQMVTWSDFSEGTQIVPSVANGHVNNDLSAYYATAWKTGSFPTILRDALYLSHRNQMKDATPQFASSTPMIQRERPGRTTLRDTVEVLTYLTAPAEVRVNIGTETHTYTAPAGEYAKLLPLGLGNINATAMRNGAVAAAVASTVPVTSNPLVQDTQYWRFSSIRGIDLQYVPTRLVNPAPPAFPFPTTSDFTANGQLARLTFPPNHNDGTPTPLIIQFEGVGDTGLTPRTAYNTAVRTKGVTYGKCQFHGDSYGSPNAMADALAVYQYALSRGPVSGVILMGNSMGGSGALNALTTGIIPNVRGVFLTDPVCNLRQRYDNGRGPEIRAAYGIAVGGADYAVKTAGYDPMLAPPELFQGVPIRIVGSSGDTSVLLALHGSALASKLAMTNNVEVTDTGTAGHNTPDRFSSNYLLPFLTKCLG